MTTSHLAGRRSNRNREGKRSNVLTAAAWALAGYFLLPLIWLIISSTKSNADLFSTFGYWFGHTFSLFTNIGQLATVDGGIFWRWMANTLIYAGVSAAGASFLATAAGYAFAKYRFPGSRALFYGVLGAIMIPTTALAVPTFLLFSRAGLTNTPWAVIIPSLVSPFGVFLMTVYAADAVDVSLIEAARIDGAGELKIFFRVGLPVLGPGIVTVLLFALVTTWNNYFLPLIMLNTSSLFPITVGLSQWQAASSSAGGGSEPLFAAVITGSLISIIPLMIAFLYLQRYWQSGLAAGSVKG